WGECNLHLPAISGSEAIMVVPIRSNISKNGVAGIIVICDPTLSLAKHKCSRIMYKPFSEEQQIICQDINNRLSSLFYVYANEHSRYIIQVLLAHEILSTANSVRNTAIRWLRKNAILERKYLVVLQIVRYISQMQAAICGGFLLLIVFCTAPRSDKY